MFVMERKPLRQWWGLGIVLKPPGFKPFLKRLPELREMFIGLDKVGRRGNNSYQRDGLQDSFTTFQTSNGAMLEERLEGACASLHSFRDNVVPLPHLFWS